MRTEMAKLSGSFLFALTLFFVSMNINKGDAIFIIKDSQL